MKTSPAKMLVTAFLTSLVAFSLLSPPVLAESRKAVNKTLSKPVVRGGIVFKNYCKLCHGERGDGMARAAKLYSMANLAISPGTPDYYFKIIRGGGKAVKKSEFMPPWEAELSEEQINDVVAYLQIVTSGSSRGEVVFKTNCILCHGIKADGKGRAAKMYDPPPANLTKSDKNDDYKTLIITLGGKAMGRSEFMPPWGDQLTDQEITDVVAYLQTMLIHE
ncbi:MAG: c-type cytochrome [Ectothiorhodospiraceae bacterium]|nr:c-type cytochrome [Ectothiorhodospiraceae bacterium]